MSDSEDMAGRSMSVIMMPSGDEELRPVKVARRSSGGVQPVAPPDTSVGADSSLGEAQRGCTVLIEVFSTSPNYLQPWKMHSQNRCKGSGFVIDGHYIVTNYHVVENAIDIRTSFAEPSNAFSLIACI